MQPVAVAQVAAGVGSIEAPGLQGAAQADGVNDAGGEGDGGYGADAFVLGGDQGQAKGQQLTAYPAAVGVDLRQQVVFGMAGHAGVEGGQQVGGEGEWDGAAVGAGAVQAEVEVAGEAGVGFGALLAEGEGQAGIGGQALAAGAAGQPYIAQVDGGGGDAADAVQGQAGVVAAAESFETGQVGQGAGGGFAVHRPQPAAGVGGQGKLNAGVVQRGAPGVGDVGVGQAHTGGVVQEAFSEFAGGDDDAGGFESGELGGHDVVGHSAGADHNGAVGGAGEAAQALADAAHQASEFGGTVGQGGLPEGVDYGRGHCHRAGGQDDGLGGGGGYGIVEAAGEFGADIAYRAVHRLVGGVVVAHRGAEGDEADVAVELLLGNAAGHYYVVVAAVAAVAGHHSEQAGEHAGAAQVGAHGQEADFAEAGAFGLGQVGFQVAQLFVQGEGAAVADADHSHEFGAAPADEVGIFVVEAVDEDAGFVGGMLGDFLDEGGVVEAVDVLELPVLVGLFENQAGAGAGAVGVDAAAAGVAGAVAGR